jgi:hypothetical protein
MRKRIFGAVSLVLGVWAAASHADDDVLRCGGHLVTVGMIAPQVVAKCGQPLTKEVEDVPVRVRGRNGAVTSSGTTRVERWTYDRRDGSFPALLTFEEGKLKSVELITKR